MYVWYVTLYWWNSFLLTIKPRYVALVGQTQNFWHIYAALIPNSYNILQFLYKAYNNTSKVKSTPYQLRIIVNRKVVLPLAAINNCESTTL